MLLILVDNHGHKLLVLDLKDLYQVVNLFGYLISNAKTMLPITHKTWVGPFCPEKLVIL